MKLWIKYLSVVVIVMVAYGLLLGLINLQPVPPPPWVKWVSYGICSLGLLIGVLTVKRGHEKKNFTRSESSIENLIANRVSVAVFRDLIVVITFSLAILLFFPVIPGWALPVALLLLILIDYGVRYRLLVRSYGGEPDEE
ncbi:hypothetical protein [Lysinibacter sp. HNR]|uniref:hypothetical protein n=1 Tax=Lysinibacter sp. HNR TaxID=3031408 RepID=UPI0024351D5A|nr:hypothetical protein [Lysinibacter sp. HNR]WGD37431.1 hypothetical protein FrondiHNR_00475 [Lysinibacter sp. HNR]